MTRTGRNGRGALLLTVGVAGLIALAWLPGAADFVVGTAACAQSVPGDVVLKRMVTPDRPADFATSVFPHWKHRLFFTCNVCHSAIFPMKAGESAISMSDIQNGHSCGVCHNGKIAWGVSISTCARCHQGQ